MNIYIHFRFYSDVYSDVYLYRSMSIYVYIDIYDDSISIYIFMCFHAGDLRSTLNVIAGRPPPVVVRSTIYI